MIDALVSAVPLERCIRQRRPPFASVLHPLATMKRTALRRSTAIRVLAIRTSEPLLSSSRNPVVLPFRNDDVRVRIVVLAIGCFASVNGKRVRQAFVGGEILRERVR